jgi:orotidine-5'-phosphate decarboxylase
MLSSQDAGDLSPGESLDGFLVRRAKGAIESGCDGLIVSGDAIGLIRSELGDEPILVCPGIRPEGAGTDDHKRSATPSQAIRTGADYLVVGRPIHRAEKPLLAARGILAEIESALV